MLSEQNIYLFQLTFAKAKLLLMSSDQEDINDWYRSICLAIGCVQPLSSLTL